MTAVFVTGGTGYLGRALIEQLIARGHHVLALVRAGSERKVPPGARVVIGNVLDASSYKDAIPRSATLVHLVGTPHPNPSKAAEFVRVDLGSIRAAAIAAKHAGVSHIVYVSVARPAPVMHAYIAAREQGEAAIAQTGIPSTILRPWYVLGPGHRWPYVLVPLFALLRLLPMTRATATRLGFVTHAQMIAALVNAIESPGRTRIVEVPEIRRSRDSAAARTL